MVVIKVTMMIMIVMTVLKNQFLKVRVAESGRDYLLHTYLGQVPPPSSTRAPP